MGAPYIYDISRLRVNILVRLLIQRWTLPSTLFIFDMLEDCMALKTNVVTSSLILFTKGKSQSIPLQSWTGPSDSKSLRLPEFLDNWHLKAVKLSVLPTGRVSPLEYQ